MAKCRNITKNGIYTVTVKDGKNRTYTTDLKVENIDKKEYSEKELRTILGRFLFYGDDVFKKASVLSPGEKARLSLCKILLEKANLLILDEPTNHLDPETQKIIGENFKNYEGTIIVVSHNIDFIKQINIDRLLILPTGKITNYSDEKLEKFLIEAKE